MYMYIYVYVNRKFLFRYDIYIIYIYITAFNYDILDSYLFRNPAIDECDMYRQFCVVLKTFLDKHAPIAYKGVSQNVPSSGMSSEILQSKRRRRYLDRL